MTTSVVICTHLEERTAQLRACLTSVFAQTLTPDEVVVVVDGDLTLANRLLADVPGVIVGCLQRRSGVSAARNFGAQIASMDIIAFLDDDATADPEWLGNLCGALRDKSVIGVSGRSIPCWEESRPVWFPEEFYWTVGCSYKGMPSTPSVVRNVYGGCAAFRRSEFISLGGFNPARGRHGEDMAGGEEAEFSMRASIRWPDRAFMFEPSAIIFHHVPRSRSSMSYLLRRCVAEGKAKSAMIRKSTISRNASFGTENRFAAAIPQAALRLLWTGVRGNRSAFMPLCGLMVASTASFVGVMLGFGKLESKVSVKVTQRPPLPLIPDIYEHRSAILMATAPNATNVELQEADLADVYSEAAASSLADRDHQRRYAWRLAIRKLEARK